MNSPRGSGAAALNHHRQHAHHAKPHAPPPAGSHHSSGGGTASRWSTVPQRSALAALGGGLLLGLLAGHLIMRHQQVVLLSHLYVTGGKSQRTLHGFELGALHAGSGASHRAELPGSWSEGGGGGGGGIAAVAATSGISSSGSGSAPRFFRAGGPAQRQSIMYSSSSVTRLTAADARRIAAALRRRAAQLPGDSVHALMTGNGSPYQNIQARIMYASLKMVQQAPGGDRVKAFTRIMHRTSDDDLVGEFPTFRSYPLQPACDTWCEFPVKDRPNAVAQWLMAAEAYPELVQGAWLLMLESDYVWMRPLQLPGSAHDVAVQGYGFQYDYIDPTYPSAAQVLREMCPDCNVSAVPHSGPAPVLLRPEELALVTPDWERYTAWIEANEHAKNVLGWVREMYAWCVAVHRNGVRLVHELPPQSRLMAQPPHDWRLGAAAILHYTWGSLYFKGKQEVWRFDKRDWTAKEHELKVPQFKLPPQPWQDGWQLQDGVNVNRELHDTLTAMLTQMNTASAALPVLTPGAAAAA